MPFERLGAEQSDVEGTASFGWHFRQRLMQAMGGSIGVKGRIGEGTTSTAQHQGVQTA